MIPAPQTDYEELLTAAWLRVVGETLAITERAAVARWREVEPRDLIPRGMVAVYCGRVERTGKAGIGTACAANPAYVDLAAFTLAEVDTDGQTVAAILGCLSDLALSATILQRLSQQPRLSVHGIRFYGDSFADQAGPIRQRGITLACYATITG